MVGERKQQGGGGTRCHGSKIGKTKGRWTGDPYAIRVGNQAILLEVAPKRIVAIIVGSKDISRANVRMSNQKVDPKVNRSRQIPLRKRPILPPGSQTRTGGKGEAYHRLL